MSLKLNLLFVSVVCTTACSSGKGLFGDECDNTGAEGYHSFTDNDITREYILYVPPNLDTSSPAPLVINFHGNGGCATNFSSGGYDGDSSLASQADAHGFIVAFPQGLIRGKGNAEWDPGNAGTTINDNDVLFTQRLIADISENHSIDANRVYATGYSNGGMMAYGLACQIGESIAAVGVMSGIMLADDSCDTNNATSVLHFHGTNDFALPYDGSGDFQSVAQVIDFWVNHNGIADGTPTSTELDNGQVTHDRYTGGSNGTVVELYTIQNGDHVWFGDSIGGEDPNDILWRFLDSYDVNGTR